AGGINHDFLCSLGRYTIDFVHSRERVERPLIRRGEHLVPATWDEAIGFVAKRLGELKAEHGGKALGVIAAGRLLNEDHYTLRRFAAEALETKNADIWHDRDEIDLATLFRHGAPTIATQEHLQNAETVLLIGSDPNEENPLTAFSIRWAVRQKAARLLTVNAVPSRLERQATKSLRVREGSEGAIILALLDGTKVAEVAEALGVTAEEVAQVRQTVLESSRVVVVFGDELRGAALESLTLLEGALPAPDAEAAANARTAWLDQLQRQVRSTNSTSKPSINENPYTYIVEHPTLEVGAEPARTATKFSFLPLVRYSNSFGAWQMGMDSALTGGMSAGAMLNSAGGGLRGLLVAGEDLILKANGDGPIVRAQLEKLDLLVVQDMFLTETAQLADVVFPVTSFAESQGTQVNNGSQVQFVRRTIPPVGQARPDWMIVSQVARQMGVDLGFQGQLKTVFKQISETVEGYAGLSHNMLANEGATAITRLAAPAAQVDQAELLGRLGGEVARVNRQLPVDRSELTEKAGTRLRQRFVQITRYSEMINPTLPETAEAETPAPVVFPA
ncbi:MAG: molybdopterin oxidoreductase family protein, partial [Acidobacteriota bacterium]